MHEVMRGMGRGRFQVNIRHENIDHLVRELDRSSNRLAISVVMAATIIASSVLLSLSPDFTLFGLAVRYLGFAGYGLALFMAAGLMAAIFRSGKLS
jgi:ubiquinone biosynthesis protein